ncbi:hypothetical protein AXG93_2682s1000 [Marchantia polymorpha subsp. ruderalis]|uniref:Uncharacterized protein n=1 Tax=Marchantia polymorpha subsp. ruderalis TaxID=1480154 RepID=A0A176WPT3_MARPO|nr:hypothetical protein AXG93_2682s1000 [Marchantia polymorpha subsp. ruderalis]
MCGRVETRSPKRSKGNERDTRRHSRKSKGWKSRGEEKASSKADARSVGRPSAMRDTPSARPKTRTNEEAVHVLRRDVGRWRHVNAPHYDVVEDKGNQQANITFNQLLEDNKTYRKVLMLSLRRPRKNRVVKLPEVYHVTSKDLGPLEINVEIGGCYIRKVPVNSGSGVNIMTEDTARCLGFQTFEPTTRVLRLADQTRRMPLGMLRNIITTIGGADF